MQNTATWPNHPPITTTEHLPPVIHDDGQEAEAESLNQAPPPYPSIHGEITRDASALFAADGVAEPQDGKSPSPREMGGLFAAQGLW